MGILRVKADTEALQQFDGLEGIRENIGFRVFKVLSASNLLYHIGEFLLKTIWAFCRGVTPLCRTECSLDI